MIRMRPLPPRNADTMSEAISLDSPSGRMSKRARNAANKRHHRALFGDGIIIEHITTDYERYTQLCDSIKRMEQYITEKLVKPRAGAREILRMTSESNLLWESIKTRFFWVESKPNENAEWKQCFMNHPFLSIDEAREWIDKQHGAEWRIVNLIHEVQE